MPGPLLRSCGKAGHVLCLLVLLLSVSSTAPGQEKLIAPVQYGTISVVDLTTLTADEVVTAGAYQGYALVSGNPQVGFVGAEFYLSVIDFSVGREVSRIYGVCPYQSAAFTSDQEYFLAEDQCGYGAYEGLTMVKTSTGKVVRRVNLYRVLGQGAVNGYLGSVLVVGNKAYVASEYGDPVLPPLAVLDLRTFKLRPVNVPSGYNDFCCGLWTPNAAVTPDQKYVVFVQDLNFDGSSHLYVISTANDQVVLDQPLSFDPVGLVITPVNAAGKVYGYLLADDTNGEASATVIDLNESSKTFGQLLPQTEVLLNTYFPSYGVSTAAINGDGSRLVVGGYKASTGNSPNPNVVELDTAQMLTNPSNAIVGSTTLGGGGRAHGFTIATISATPLPTAPTVTQVSPASITNDVANTITVTGTNFASGASVRIGTSPTLAATVKSSTSLQVTVPKNFPAQASLDVVVRNFQPNGPKDQHYQSGVLPAALTVLPNPAFQPNNQFAALNLSTYSVSVADLQQETMINVPNVILPYGVAFSTDGAGIYAPSYGPRGIASRQVAEWSPSDDSLRAQVPLPGVQNITTQAGELALAPSVDPSSGDPVVFVPVSTFSSGQYDIGVRMVDTKTNTLTKSLAAGLNGGFVQVYGAAATPNGGYVYVNAEAQSGLILVFDVALGIAVPLSTQTLGVNDYQSEMTVSPDGQSLLLQGASGNGMPIAVFDISINPNNPTLVTTITGTPPPGAPPFAFSSWKVANNLLFALDNTQNAVVAFVFNRDKNNFSQIGYYLLPLRYFTSNLAVSPDGSLIYIPISNYDLIAALDANALINGQNPLITNIGAFVFPYQVIVSPGTDQDKDRQSRPTADSSRNTSPHSVGRVTLGSHGAGAEGKLQQPASELRGRGVNDTE